MRTVLDLNNEEAKAFFLRKERELVYRRVDASLPLIGMLSYDKKREVSVKKTVND